MLPCEIDCRLKRHLVDKFGEDLHISAEKIRYELKQMFQLKGKLDEVTVDALKQLVEAHSAIPICPDECFIISSADDISEHHAVIVMTTRNMLENVIRQRKEMGGVYLQTDTDEGMANADLSRPNHSFMAWFDPERSQLGP